MRKMHFENTNEFERVFKKKDEEVTDAIAEAIQEALEGKKKTAYLFQVSFEDAEMSYEITLPSTQWETALKTCLEHYTQIDASDKAIEVYLMQKQIKTNKKRTQGD